MKLNPKTSRVVGWGLAGLLLIGAVPGLAQNARNTTQAVQFIKLANTLREVNKSQESISLLRRAMPAVRGKNAYWEAVTNELLGLCHRDLDQRAEALPFLERARTQYADLRYVASAWGVNEIIREISGKNRYAGIQINPSDVKLVILKTDYETDFYEKNVRTVIELPGNVLPDASLSADASGALRPGADALRACFDSLRRYDIPAGRTFVVLSSEVRQNLNRNPANRRQFYDQLARALPDASLKIDTTLTPEREAELFTVGAIPRKVWSSTSALHLGPISTLGGYFEGNDQPGRMDKTFRAVNLPVGVNTLVEQVEGKRSLSVEAFRREAPRVVNAAVESALRPRLEALRSGLTTRRTVGLGGDVALALVAYLHPERATTPAVPITFQDVERFKNGILTDVRALARPDLSTLADPDLRRRAEADLGTVSSRLNEKQLLVGALWLEALMKQFPAGPTPKRFVFIRDADVGWVTGKFLETINYEYESTIARGALYTR